MTNGNYQESPISYKKDQINFEENIYHSSRRSDPYNEKESGVQSFVERSAASSHHILSHGESVRSIQMVNDSNQIIDASGSLSKEVILPQPPTFGN